MKKTLKTTRKAPVPPKFQARLKAYIQANRLQQIEERATQEAARLKATFDAERAKEAALDIRLVAHDTWSGGWWHSLSQLNIQRLHVIAAAQQMAVNPLGPSLEAPKR